MNLIDTHAHLYAEEFDADIAEVIERSIQNNVSHILLPNIDTSTIDRLKTTSAISNTQLSFLPMMGLHPCYVKADVEEQLSVIKNDLFSNANDYIGVGEIGLDYYWDTTFKEQQIMALQAQIDWAIALQKPVAIHCRDAYSDLIEILTKKKHPDLRGVLHCFGGSIEEAKQLINLGFYLGIGGVLTYKKSGLDLVIKEIDLSFLVLETDAPYLPPVPFRGKRNESAYLVHIAEKLAEVKNVSLDMIADITTKNAKQLFNIN